MTKALQTLRYLSKTLKGMTLIGLGCILATLVLTELIFELTNSYYHAIEVRQDIALTAPMDVIAGIFALLTGLVFFITTFKVVLANGISRKTFLLANIPAAAMIAAIYSIFNVLLVQVWGLAWPVTLSSQLFFPYIGWAGLLVFQFALYFLLVEAGWFIALAYYRSSIPLRWAISLAPIGVIALLQMANGRTGGAVFEAIVAYYRATMAMERAPLTLLVYAVLLCGLVYLLIRRAPLKD